MAIPKKRSTRLKTLWTNALAYLCCRVCDEEKNRFYDSSTSRRPTVSSSSEKRAKWFAPTVIYCSTYVLPCVNLPFVMNQCWIKNQLCYFSRRKIDTRQNANRQSDSHATQHSKLIRMTLSRLTISRMTFSRITLSRITLGRITLNLIILAEWNFAYCLSMEKLT